MNYKSIFKSTKSDQNRGQIKEVYDQELSYTIHGLKIDVSHEESI